MPAALELKLIRVPSAPGRARGVRPEKIPRAARLRRARGIRGAAARQEATAPVNVQLQQLVGIGRVLRRQPASIRTKGNDEPVVHGARPRQVQILDVREL